MRKKKKKSNQPTNEYASWRLEGLALRNTLSVQHRNNSVWFCCGYMLCSCCCLMAPQNLWRPWGLALVPRVSLMSKANDKKLLSWEAVLWHGKGCSKMEKGFFFSFFLFYLLYRWHILWKTWSKMLEIECKGENNLPMFRVLPTAEWLLKG